MYNFDNLIKFCEENNLTLSDHFYHGRYGDWKVSVTELLSILVSWVFEHIKLNHTEALEKACARWTLVHENIENNISERPKSASDKPKPTALYYRRWREWKVCSGVNILEKEQDFFRDEIRGTIDAITDIWVVDYKSSMIKNKKYWLQICAYCWLSWHTTWWILHLNEKKYEFVEVDVEKYMPVFLELLEYSRLITKINQN